MPTTDAIRWFKTEFGAEIEAAIAGTPYTLDMLVAIACQETGLTWNALRKLGLSTAQVLELCVGDTLDEDKGRSAFPKTKAALLAEKRGDEMFKIARDALVAMAKFITAYKGAASNPNKFCHGFGVFQYDIQFFRVDPEYFLQRKYVHFDETLRKCIGELKNAQTKNGWAGKTTLTELEMIGVAIAYNAGSYKPSAGLKQGHFDGGKFYGENIFDFLRLSATVDVDGPAPVAAPGPALTASPTPVTAIGPVYEVDTSQGVLRLRREPRIDPANVLANLPDGHIVRAVTGAPVKQFMEVETSLDGAFFRGFCSEQFLKLRPDSPLVSVETAAPAPPQGGVVAVYMPRADGTITRRVDIAGPHSLNENGQPGRTGAGADELRASLAAIVEWLATDKATHKRYQPRDGLTFCNIYAHDYCNLAGVYLPRVWWTSKAIAMLSAGGSVEPKYGQTIVEMRANDLFRWLREFGLEFGWRQTGTLTKLQMEVNQGAVGLIIAHRKQDTAPGHVAMVVPETATNQAKRSPDGDVVAPLQSQAGGTNFRYGTGAMNWWKGEQFAEFAFWIHA